MRRISSYGIIVGAFLLTGPDSVRAENFCDSSLAGDTKSPLAYQMRGDRCEGLYAQQVSAISIEIRSFVESLAPFDPQRESVLDLRWLSPPEVAKELHLRAFCFKPRTYYRMDTAVPAARRMYRWPSEVLAGLQLAGADLGVIAWLEMPGPASTVRQVYLPLRVGASETPAEGGYQVTLVPSVRLKEVYLTVSRLDSSGNIVATVRRDEALGYGYYPSNEPTRFSTGRLGSAGFFRLELAAVPMSGTPVKQGFDFYHSVIGGEFDAE